MDVYQENFLPYENDFGKFVLNPDIMISLLYFIFDCKKKK